MKAQSQNSDRISALPQDTTEKILTLMPLRHAIRTSILSKKWRYCWTRIPKLVFDDNLVNLSSRSGNKELDKYKLVNAVFHILLLHRAPISELCINIANVGIDNEIDKIIVHLSWSKNIKKFILEITSIGEYYKLPCSFFSFQGWEHLDLSFCKIELPLMFNGFNMLKSLVFNEVKMTAKVLIKFLTNCPLLEEFTSTPHAQTCFTETTFVELFKCLPSIQVLEISRLCIKHLAGSIPRKLPISLPHLRIVVLSVCLLGLSAVLCVISSSPNLEKIELEICDHQRRCSALITFKIIQAYSGINLHHLKEMEITCFRDLFTWMEFVKLVMAKSPVLKKARVELDTSVSVDPENKMLRGLLLLPFPRASPAAKFIIERP
ncbi:F-box/FBD/LRR-repeat protein At1g13570 [Lactuca sativa]|uniref:F-box/FBD/LRR-repeat protein At1g13570 n=1 Tax=Lactuca sativa TaxID=4236 RepID=UPI000CD84158|nr:F-box/FBD/LRR-repeat protein At1g13570 [Lactuca sativa]